MNFRTHSLLYFATGIAFFTTKGPNILFFKKIYLAIPVILFGVVLLWYLSDGMGDMKIPVTLYCIVILTMLLAAINRKSKVNRQSYQYGLLGALLFVLSDTMIAINKFEEPFELARMAIMTAYITAQYFIAMGCLRQYNLTLKK